MSDSENKNRNKYGGRFIPVDGTPRQEEPENTVPRSQRGTEHQTPPIEKTYYHVVDGGEGGTVGAIPADPFVAARYERLSLLRTKEWMELTDAGLTSKEAWKIADDRMTERWFGEEGH